MIKKLLYWQIQESLPTRYLIWLSKSIKHDLLSMMLQIWRRINVWNTALISTMEIAEYQLQVKETLNNYQS